MRQKNPQKNLFKVNPKSNWTLMIGVFIIILLVGLAAKGKSLFNAQSILRPAPSPTEVEISQNPTEALPMTNSDYVDQAVSALAINLNISKDDIKVVSTKETTWSDASLGCPKRGMIYAQVIIPGYLINLSAKGVNYEYHAGSNRVITCAQ